MGVLFTRIETHQHVVLEKWIAELREMCGITKKVRV